MILTVAFVMAPQTVLAQQAPKTARIGWLASGGADRNSVFLTSFSQAMRELGYLEGNNLIIEARYAAGQYKKLPALAAEVIALKPASSSRRARPPHRRRRERRAPSRSS